MSDTDTWIKDYGLKEYEEMGLAEWALEQKVIEAAVKTSPDEAIQEAIQ